MTIAENQLISNKYWTKKLKSSISIDKFVCDKKLVCTKLIDRNELSYLSKLSGKKPIVEFTILYSIFNTLLNKYLDFETEFVLTNKINNAKKLLLLHSNSKEAESLKELLNETKKEIQEVYKFSEYDEKLTQTHSFSDYTTVGFSYGEYSEKNYSKCHFVLQIEENSGNLKLKISFYENFIEKIIVNHFLNSLHNWLINLEANLNKSIKSIDLLSKKEKHQILNEFNDTKKEYPKDKTIINLFEGQVESTPNNIAVTYEELKLTYFELNEKVNQFANYISKNYSISKGDVIVVLLPKSIDTIISYLTILKLGAIYLPVDISNPKSRIDYILKDSHSKLVISDSNTLANQIVESDSIIDVKSFQNHKFLKDNFNRKISPADIAYLIYTSGSTGNPKGVLIRHTSNVNMSLDQIREFQITEEDNVAWFASVGFDASISEMMMCFYSGATLVIPTDEQIKNTDEFIGFINEQSISVVTFPPSYLDLIDSENLKSLRCIITAGEKANPIKVKEVINQDIDYYNAYGPTEYSVCTSIYKVPKDFDTTQVPIGKPIANTNVYILDSNLNLQPIGISGKLYVSGVGLAKGYLNRTNLNQEKFIANPFNLDTLIYDTGDVAKWDTNGNIIFEGRKDFQVKIRGHRVELGEIEVVISNYSKDLIQIVVEPKLIKDTNHLIAYYTLKRGKHIEKELLRKYLEGKLPEYMIPSFFIELDEIPITQNGKVDRKTLPNPNSKDSIRKENVAPRNEIEKKLVEIWEEILGVEKVGITDNFFQLGGNSLHIMQILSKVNKSMNVSFSIDVFFRNATIAALSNMLTSIDSTVHAEGDRLLEENDISYAQKRIWLMEKLEAGSQYHITNLIEINSSIDQKRLEESFQNLLEEHSMLRSVYAEEDGQVTTSLLEAKNWRLETTSITVEKRDLNLERIIHTPFDLANDFPIRAALLSENETTHTLCIVTHHIVSDGWSNSILMNSLMEKYQGITRQDAAEIRWEYQKFVQEERRKESNSWQQNSGYWKQKLTSLEKVNIPKRHDAMGQEEKDEAQSIEFTINSHIRKQIKELSKEQEVTLFMFLLSIFKIAISKLSNQEQICIGSPISLRDKKEYDQTIGCFLNVLPFVSNCEDEQSYATFLSQLKTTTIDALSHKDLPFEKIVEIVNPDRTDGDSPIFQILFNFISRQHTEPLQEQDLPVKVMNNEWEKSKYDITLYVFESEELTCRLVYKSQLFNETRMKMLKEYFEATLDMVISDPVSTLKEIKNALSNENSIEQSLWEELSMD